MAGKVHSGRCKNEHLVSEEERSLWIKACQVEDPERISKLNGHEFYKGFPWQSLCWKCEWNPHFEMTRILEPILKKISAETERFVNGTEMGNWNKKKVIRQLRKAILNDVDPECIADEVLD